MIPTVEALKILGGAGSIEEINEQVYGMTGQLLNAFDFNSLRRTSFELDIFFIEQSQLILFKICNKQKRIQ